MYDSQGRQEQMQQTNIHPTAIIGENVRIGAGTTIGAYTVIHGPTNIGERNTIGSHVVIGSPPEDRHPKQPVSEAWIEIGDENTIREFTAIQKPSLTPLTSIGNGCYIMRNCHIPHDARVGSSVTMSPFATLGGSTIVQDSATIGIGACTHQFSVIGGHSMVAMNATVVKNIPPFTTFIPGKPLGINKVGLKRAGMVNVTVDLIEWLETGQLVKGSLLESTRGKMLREWEQLHQNSKRSRVKWAAV